MRRLALVAVLAALAISASASAQAPGLYIEDRVTDGQVTVRRIRDTREHTVCFVSTASSYYSGAPAMHCQPEGK